MLFVAPIMEYTAEKTVKECFIFAVSDFILVVFNFIITVKVIFLFLIK